MDYKEKYNKLVEAIKVLQETNSSDEGIQNWVNDNVPELAESEDEKIRKTLIEYFNAYPKDYYCELKTSCIIAWLEKQGETSTDDFGEFINILSKQFPEVSFAKLSRIAVRVKKWLEKQGTSYTKRDVDDAYLEGMAFAKDELEKQRPTWSEEDEVRLQACIDTLQAKSIMGKVDTINTNWLKSLKQRIGG